MAKRQKRTKKPSVDAKNCVHNFAATEERGEWRVEALPTNNRGTSKWVEVGVTVFECTECGAKKEFPDSWEPNFVAPAPQITKARPKKAPAKRKTKKA